MYNDEYIANHTDSYFKRTKKIVSEFGDVIVEYAFFIRRPVIYAPRKMLEFLQHIVQHRSCHIEIAQIYQEGDVVGAGESLIYLKGLFSEIVDLETLLLQRLGPACVAAYNAYIMCKALPKTSFLAMDARHCTGVDMMDMMAYAASVGSQTAQKHHQAKGFIGNATNATCHYFHQPYGLGTMPHALIGYASSTLEASKYYHQAYPDEPLVVLIDYFAKELTDAIEVCQYFHDLVEKSCLYLRMDTMSGRYIEGLDNHSSYQILHQYAPHSITKYCHEEELKYLVGPGVSSAAIWKLRTTLDQHGFEKVKIVASSGFNPDKCLIFHQAQTPVDMIGTGSFLPEKWSETYATADIVSYHNEERVKKGREFLLPSLQSKPIQYQPISK